MADSTITKLVPPSGETGVAGTINFTGNIRSESNSKLFWTLAYGQPGNIQWGEWETLHRTDNCISTALQIVCAPLRDAELEINPVNESEEEARIAEFCEDNLRDWLEPTWSLFIEQVVQWGLMYGFSLHEKVWGTRADDRVPGGQAVYLKKLAHRLPSSIEYNGFVEKDNDLALIRQCGVSNGKFVSAQLPADKVLLATWQRNGNNYAGFSQFRSIWYLAKMRMELLKILAIGSSREALGVPTVSPDPTLPLTKDQQTQLQSMLENLVYHENAAAVLPPGAKMEWVFSPTSNKGHVLELWKELGLAILETVSAQQVYLGTSNTGSRAVGQVHQIQQTVFVSGVRAWLEAVLNGIGEQKYTGLIRQIVEFNFGSRAKYPKIKFTLKPPKLEAGEMANAVQAFVNAGALHLVEEDEAEIREILGLSTNPDRERLMPIEPAPETKMPEFAFNKPKTTDQEFPAARKSKSMDAAKASKSDSTGLLDETVVNK